MAAAASRYALFISRGGKSNLATPSHPGRFYFKGAVFSCYGVAMSGKNSSVDVRTLFCRGFHQRLEPTRCRNSLLG